MKAGLAVRLGMAIAATFAAAVAGAQGPGGPGAPGFGMHRPPMERAMRSHNEFGRWWNNPKIVEKLKHLRANVEKAEVSMEPLVKADQPNESAVMSQIDKVAQARAELEKANARFLFALRAKLTPDQWKQVQDFRQNHEGMRREWRHDGRGPADGPGGHPGDDKGPPLPPPGPQGMLGDDSFGENSSLAVNQ